MGWLARKVWPFLMMAGLTVAYVFSIRDNGKLVERIKHSERTNTAQTRMRDAVARTRMDRTSVVERLHNGQF
jgi:hypothetical protein